MPAEIHPPGYFALVLHKPSQDLLLSGFATLPFRTCHHCTVAYGTDHAQDLPSAFRPDDVGKEFQLRVTGHALRADRGIEAVAVELVGDDGEPIAEAFSTNRVPHVTIATDGVTEACESNALLEAGFAPVDGPLVGCTLARVPPQDESLRRHPEISMAGDEVLRRVADPLTPEEIASEDTRRLVMRMRRILGETVGAGLAAPQVRVSKRLICVEVREMWTFSLRPTRSIRECAPRSSSRSGSRSSRWNDSPSSAGSTRPPLVASDIVDRPGCRQWRGAARHALSAAPPIAAQSAKPVDARHQLPEARCRDNTP